jgi:outer membrane protein assembly factor BamA
MRGRTPIILVLSAVALAAQVPVRTRTPTVAPIVAIGVTGNKTLGADTILVASGLKKGDDGGSAIFDAARDRLLNTGYFDLVSYTFKTQDLGFAITFSVIELKQLFPLHVEALPVSLDQVKQLLKAKDPLFNRLLPGTKPVIDRAAAVIEQWLAVTSPGTRVRARVVNVGPDRYEVQFSPADGLPVIANVSFEGSKLIREPELRAAILEGAIGQVFSEASVQALLDHFIRPLYEKQGYMLVSFPKVSGVPAAEVKGIEVKVTVAEGPRYKLDSISVHGAMIGDSRRILRIANLPQMDFMNTDEFLQAVPRIRDTLRGEGYLDVAVSTDRSIDEATKTVNAWFDVVPGDLYTFGRLEVLGLGLDGEAAIRKMWNVKTGDPFPGAYPDYFVQRVKEDGLFDNLGAATATLSVNRETRTVDVSLNFAGAPPAQRRRVQF